MFFSISNRLENNFTANYNVGPVWINVDAGWKTNQLDNYLVIYKGYSENFCLDQVLGDIQKSVVPFDLGNYCCFFVDKTSGQISVKTDQYRGFPIYYESGKTVTNLQKKESTVWTNKLVSITPDISVNETKFNIIGKVPDTTLDYAEVISKIDNLLHQKTKNFLTNNQLPIRVHLSGGVDSLLVYAYLKSHTDKFELVKCAHIDYDRFWLLNNTDIQQYWGYNQIHHWTEPCVLTSGAPGDEFMLRSPVTADRYLKARGILITDLLNDPKWKNCLHRDYFQQQKHLDIFDSQTIDHKKTVFEHNWNLCNININDWQHWHLGNTLTWTPLKDLEIFKLMLQLPIEHAVAQILDSAVSKKLLSGLDNNLLNLISDQKNSHRPMKNLVDMLV
jgi:hypothetical protein